MDVERTVFRTILKAGAFILAQPVSGAFKLVTYFQDKSDEKDRRLLEELKDRYRCVHLELLPASEHTGCAGVRSYVAAKNGCAFRLKGTWFWHPDPKFRILQKDDFVCRYVGRDTVDVFLREKDNAPGQHRRSCALCSEYYKKNK